jgi:hypothetical protein
MKKTFPLQAPGRDDARVRDKIRQEINTYVRRERQKKPPEGFDGFEVACKVGADGASAEMRGLKEVGSAIDTVALAGATAVYVEIVVSPSARKFSR